MKELIRRGRRVIGWLGTMKIPVYASHAGFFLVLSVFPLLVLLLSLLRYTGLTVDSLTDLLAGVVPDVFLPAARQLILSTYQSTGGTVVSVSAVTALWSASRGLYGLTAGLNRVYGVSDRRGWLLRRSLSVAYTFALLVTLLLNVGVYVFGGAVLQRLSDSLGLPGHAGVRFLLLPVTLTVLFAGVYTWLPNRRGRFSQALPGAMLAAGGWLLFSRLYSVYALRFAGLSRVYGPVYAIALSLLWLYCCVSILFYGGALNRWLLGKENMEKM